jgi:deoxyribonuclease IV
MLLGAHVSSAGGYAKARARGQAIGAEVIQGFSQSPRQWKAPALDLDVLRADREAERFGIEKTFLHATYLINLATANDELREKSVACLTENLVAGTAVGCDGVVLHIGSHLGEGLDATLARITDAIRRSFDDVEERTGESSCRLLLENAAGAGHTVGRSFEEIAQVIEAAGDDARLGMCLDTQHLFASGIGFDTPEIADTTIAHLDATIGLDRLGLIHLNDSKVPFGANRDRHENLGEGCIGAAALAALLGSPRLAGVTAVLEVPGTGDGPRTEDMVVARAILAEGVAARA